jgi:hypothetical protein
MAGGSRLTCSTRGRRIPVSREIGLLLKPDMVRATIARLKKETRRTRGLDVLNHDGGRFENPDLWTVFQSGGEWHARMDGAVQTLKLKCPYGRPGDTLWVRETWVQHIGEYGEKLITLYAANYPDLDVRAKLGPWKPSIHMPRRLCRLTLTVREIGLERLQNITNQGILDEGVQIPVTKGKNPCVRITGPHLPVDYSDKNPNEWTETDWLRTHFASLWDTINAKRGLPWASNPWVWVVRFTIKELSDG